eukprot:scaffold9210_cov80-Skeletonema_menzelii.AAC.8
MAEGMTLTKDLVVRLDQDYVQCIICFQAFTTDMESAVQTNSNKPEAAACLGFCADTIFVGWSQWCIGCPNFSRADQFVPEDLDIKEC